MNDGRLGLREGSLMTLTPAEAEVIRTMRGSKYQTVIIKLKDGKPVYMEVHKGVQLSASSG